MIAARVAAIVVVVTCTACGGGGGGGGGTPAVVPPPVNTPPTASPQSAGGMWFALTGGSSAVSLMIAETGEMRVTAPPTASSGPAFGHGAVAVTGNRVAGSFETRAVQPSPTSPPGAELECTLEGTVSTRVSMDVTVVCTDDAGSATTTSLAFRYDARYDADSSLALIAGNYTMPLNSTGNSLNINGDGTLFGVYQNGPRCTLNGRVEIVDENFNLYRFEVLFSNCTVLQQFEGVTMTGLATRDLPGQKAGAFHLLMTAVVGGRIEFASLIYEPV